MELHFATTNKGKVESLKREIKGYSITIIHSPLQLPEPRSNNIQEIAKQKALHAYKQLKKPVVVLDASFCIPSLNDFPGTFVNFALETIDIHGILTLAKGKNRECCFKECIAYLDNELQEPRFFQTTIKGTLSSQPKGTLQPHHWSALSLIFIPQGKNHTLAEMTHQEFFDWFQEIGRKNSPFGLFCEWITKKL